MGLTPKKFELKFEIQILAAIFTNSWHAADQETFKTIVEQ